MHAVTVLRFNSKRGGFLANLDLWVGLRLAVLEYSADGYVDADAGSIGVRFTWRPWT